ncbi:S-methyl-5-thioribose-1-phosphate isomerase [Candidatus Bipolaricaulota bacterium]|nr:S-methyl-5-thioribose-1-phosphate isomerase [Candidatus Bipolaricaulota bacterium]
MVFKQDSLKLIDQRKLPSEVQYFQADDYREVKFAISDMVVRGAPAIGATAAYGVYLAALEYSTLEKEEFIQEVTRASEELKRARPTAVNLAWAIRKMNELIYQNREKAVKQIVRLLREGAEEIAKEDVKINKKMARHGNRLIPEEAGILTHCNTGALATVGYGTALGVIREAHRSGKDIQVYADETRPRLQGARLTAFELVEEEIPATLIVDSAAATLIRDGKIDLILVGADRVAANGDTANKIGTYNLSALADIHEVPFYVVAPTSTIDFEVENGDEIEIEERAEEEVKGIQEVQIAPEAVNVYNPAFDVSPAENISGIVTEKGIARPPLEESLQKLGGYSKI